MAAVAILLVFAYSDNFPDEQRSENVESGEDSSLTKQGSETVVKDDDFKCYNFKPGLQAARKPAQVEGPDLIIHDVIVIGAGVAGLEAANELYSERMDVVVLEARDRIGGRVWTHHDNGTALDIGGSWIHGLSTEERENPIYKIARTNDIELNKTDIDYRANYYTSSGGEIATSPDDYLYEYFNEAEYFNEGISEHEKRKLSIEDVVKKFKETRDDWNETDFAMLSHSLEWAYDNEQIANIAELSFKNFELDQYFESAGNEAIFPKGYNQIVNCIAEGLDIRHATVTKVDYENLPIVVYTDEGTFQANYVISTLPLGVLQKNTVEFYPILTKTKLEAIDSLEMGTMDKIYLIFDDDVPPFWIKDKDSKKEWIQRVNLEGDDTYGTNWKFFMDFHKFTNRTILLAFNTAESATKLENEDNSTIKKQVTEVLRKMYPKSTIPEPRILPTRWATDPLSWGSYAYIPPGGSPTDLAELARPIDDKLFFAGEATNQDYFGTVHGAYISGYRAAQEILKLENKIDSPREQLEHGMKIEDLICGFGERIVDKTSAKTVKCIPTQNTRE